jgi:putative spermidine/putrescine transport system permease protein
MSNNPNRGTGVTLSSAGSRYWRSKSAYLGVIPFLVFTGIFLLYPTWNVVTGAFQDDQGQFDTAKVKELAASPIVRNAFYNSLEISFKTAILGAILGGLFAWALTTGKPGGIFYNISVALSSVLAQFGGVMLTFAFLATFGFNGVISSIFVKLSPDSFLAQSAWLYTLNGLAVVYTFFQIPLMVLVFLPTIENMKPQWREASDSLGGSAREYWVRVGIPVLTPSFFGAMLLLFVNSFSAYATAATLVNMSDFLTPLQIGNALSSEVGGANPQEAKALSLAMVIVVIIVMFIYAQIRRRVSRWESSR